MEGGSLARTWLLGLMVIAAVLVATAGSTYYNLHAIWTARQSATTARQLVESIKAFQSAHLDAELNEADFLLTRDAIHQEQLRHAILNLRSAMAALAVQPSVGSEAAVGYSELWAQTDLELTALDSSAATAIAESPSELPRPSAAPSETAPARAVRALVEQLKAHGEQVLAERRDTSNENYQVALIGCWLTGVSGLLAVIAFGILTRRQLRFQRRVLQTLHSQKEHLRVTLGSIGDAVITTDAVCLVSYLNEVAEDLTGWKSAEAEGRHLEEVFQIINETTRRKIENPAARALSAGKVIALANHTVLVARDGLERTIEDSAAPIRGVDGEIVGVVLVFRDISERAKDERALRSANERIQLALEAGAIVGTWIWDVARSEIVSDEQLAAAFSIDPAEAAQGLPIGRYLDMIHVDDVERVRRLAGEAVETGNAFRAEFRLRLSGGTMWVEGSGRAEYDSLGAAVRFPGVVVDVTEHHRTERQMAMAQRAGGIGAFEWRADSPYLTVSEEYCRLLGLPYRERVLLVDLIQQVHPEDQELIRQEPVADRNPLHHAEFRILRANDGAWRWIARTGQQVDRDESSVPLYAGVIFDVTERKRAEEELKSLNETLDRRVRERTRELESQVEQRERAEDQLRHVQKIEAVGQLTGGLAHDFNNMLTGITASLEMLKSPAAQARPGEFNRYIDVAMASAQRAAALTHRLLAFSRRQPLDARPTNVVQLTVAMQDLLRNVLGPAIELRITAVEPVWTTLCDPHQLESALLNLAINSRDAMAAGGQFAIEIGNTSSDQRDFVGIRVVDNGDGMPPDVLTHAFEPFFTTKPQGEGTGLGLSMIHGFVNQSGGSIELASQPGRGTTVSILLPRYLGAAEPQPRPATPMVAPAGTGRHKILVVDDEEAIRTLVAEHLADEGHELLTAEDARSALKLIDQHADIDLMISDIGLPGGLNGRQLSVAFLEKRVDACVLLITGYAGNAGVDPGLLGPRLQVLAKPFSFDQLTARIRGLFAPA